MRTIFDNQLLPEDVIGGALPGKKKELDYDKFKKEFLKDITSNDDLLAFDNLVSDDKEFSALVDGQEINKNKKIKLTNANAKALGVLNHNSKKLDGYIVMNDLTDSLLIADGAEIAAFTANEGDAGSLNITANSRDAIAF